jgi:hypothetical protein
MDQDLLKSYSFSQCLMKDTNPNPDPEPDRGFDDQKLKKMTA